jgi:hypothetical protein
VSLTACNSFPVPKTELCIGTEEGDLACSYKDDSYFRELMRSDIVTNADDYRILKQYVNDLREKLIICKRR